MADERTPPAGSPSDDDPIGAPAPVPAAAGRPPEEPRLDATSPMPATDDAADEPGDATAPFERAVPGDATAPFERVESGDATAPMSRDGDATAPLDRQATAAMPAVAPGVAAGASGTSRWAGRAEVPPAGAAGVREAAPAGWVVDESPADPYAGRSWFMPIMIGILALLLLAVLGVGVWLILRATRTNAPPAPAIPSSAPSVSPPPTTALPSSAPPTTAPPSSAAPSAEPSTAPAAVAVAAVRGMSRADATAALVAQGLSVTVTQQPDASVPAGTAIGTNPPAGTPVDPGSRVVLLIASAPRSPAPRSSAAAPASPAASAAVSAASTG